MAEIHESGEDYLEAILRLHKEFGIARSVDVAKKLNVSKPSVSRAMGILEDNGYVTVNEIGALELTEKGKLKADEVYERHVLLTRFLVKITGVSEEQAEENACKIEHDIDDDVKKGIQKWMEKNA
ncbi:metal-dependent transcriptional regulator [Treponema sp.]|uniref:metal-dependent transcriptional regulator n=1 Tax=Treponema sp. TaxID=166 RepID=UPI0025F79486|nr:metal-dependent transcriptional regulator [Treponema sp.]MCR5219222.1 metal-dependent transcriptional regulator [Treponema sp.]